VPLAKGVYVEAEAPEEDVAAQTEECRRFAQAWSRAVAEDSGAVVQLLRYRTPSTRPPWPVRCLCVSHIVGTSSQLNVRAWCPGENGDSAHLHRIATSRGCSWRRRGSCSPRWPTRDWRRYAIHARASNIP
jgi:hypothetical protein